MGIFIITVSSLNIFSTGCNSIDERYYSRLDSLDVKLSQTYQFLQIDVSTIDERNNHIFDHLRYVDMFYVDQMTEEFGNHLAKYKGIKKTYSHFMKEYGKIFNEMKSLKIQAKNLRQAIDHQELTKEEFKVHYATESNDIEANRMAAEQLSASIHSLEPEYQRISRIISEALDRIALSNPRLQDYLNNLNQQKDTTT